MGFLYFIGIFFHKEKKSKKQQHFHRKKQPFHPNNNGSQDQRYQGYHRPRRQEGRQEGSPQEGCFQDRSPRLHQEGRPRLSTQGLHSPSIPPPHQHLPPPQGRQA